MGSEQRQTRRGWLWTLSVAAGCLAGCSAPQTGGRDPSDGTAADGDPQSNDSQRTSGMPEEDHPASTGSGSWSTFRGGARNTGCAAAERGPVGVPEEKWSVSTDGGVWSSPVVADGRLYVGSMDRTLYAIDAATGDVDWTYETGGPIQSTPAVEDGRVYVGSFDRHVYCLDAATGEEQWRYETSGLVNSSPTVSGSTLYVGSGVIRVAEVHEFLESSDVEQEGGGLYALDRETGALEWRQFPDHLVSSTPAVVDSTVYIATTGGDDAPPLIASLAAADGTLRWGHEVDAAMIASPTVQSNTVYCGSYAGTVHALSAETGDEEWTFSAERGDIRGSTAIYDGSVYVPVSGNEVARRSDNPVLYSLSLDGDVQWRHEIVGGRQMGSSPAVTEEAVYVGTHHRDGDGGMYAVSHGGDRLWGREVSGAEGVGTSPALVDGTLYYGADDGSVYAVE